MNDFELPQVEQNDDTLTYVGRFDEDGVPIVVSRYLSEYASVAFQVLSLANLMEHCIQPGPLQEIWVDYTDETLVGVVPDVEGFLAYYKAEPKRRRY